MTATLLRRTADSIAELSPDLSVRAIQVFAAVAANEGLSVSDYANNVHMPLSTVSRLLLDLAGIPRDKTKPPGPALLERRPNLQNLREQNYKLAPKGHGLILKLTREIARASA